MINKIIDIDKSLMIFLNKTISNPLFDLIMPIITSKDFLTVLALSIMGSLQSVGIILLLSMLITPAAAAKIVMKNFYALMIVGSLFGVIASVSGLYFSYYLDLPSGPSMALSATCVFVVVWSLRKGLMYGK